MVTETVGRLARMASCPAVRGSLERAEMAMPTQIDHVASSGVNTSWASRSGPRMNAVATPGCAKSSTTATNRAKTA